MIVGQVLQIALAVIGLSCVASVVVIAVAKVHRGRAGVRSSALLVPYRHALIAMASGEDEDGQAKASLYAVPAPTWDRLRPSVVAFLTKVRGTPADDLGELLRSRGEIEAAQQMLTSRSGVRRARAAYLLGVVRDVDSVALLLPLLGDPHADVRLVAARALGAIGEPSAEMRRKFTAPDAASKAQFVDQHGEYPAVVKAVAVLPSKSKAGVVKAAPAV